MQRETLDQLRDVSLRCAGANAWALSDDQLVASLDVVHEAEQVLAAAKAHLISEINARGLPTAQGATTVVAWLRARFRMSPSAAGNLVHLAGHLKDRPVLDAALSSGAVSAEQAKVIAGVIAQLPAEVGAQVIDQAE